MAFDPTNPDPNSPEYAAWYYSFPPTTRAYLAAPGSADATYKANQTSAAYSDPTSSSYGGSPGPLPTATPWSYTPPPDPTNNPINRYGPSNPAPPPPVTNPLAAPPPGTGLTSGPGTTPPPATTPPPPAAGTPGAPAPKAGALTNPYALTNPLSVPGMSQPGQPTGTPASAVSGGTYSGAYDGGRFTAPSNPGMGFPTLAGAGRTVGSAMGTFNDGSGYVNSSISGGGTIKPMTLTNQGQGQSGMLTGDTLSQLLNHNPGYAPGPVQGSPLPQGTPMTGVTPQNQGQSFDPWAQSRQIAGSPGYDPNNQTQNWGMNIANLLSNGTPTNPWAASQQYASGTPIPQTNSFNTPGPSGSPSTFGLANLPFYLGYH